VTYLELLAPAGNTDIGKAAIDHGADAVYIGAPRFGARADAGANLNDIAHLIEYAHIYYAKVYVALNTILNDSEISEAEHIIHEVYQAGADGLIIQDVGILELDLPPIPLIASTQMHNSTLEKIQFLEAVGFKRVILPREISLPDISALHEKTHIELEAFVHGALCVSYSGQCYMSQAACGRSGNRGVCAQPCRFAYSLTDCDGKSIKQGKYLLSLKDLNLLKAIPDLVKAGVTSFKIEGRYKALDYVKNITAAYRQTIDRLIDKRSDLGRSSSGMSTFSFTPDPTKTFNRGYTQYFVYGKSGKVGSVDTQKSIGRLVGTVASVGKDFFRVNRAKANPESEALWTPHAEGATRTPSNEHHDLINGDGLCFFTKKGDLAGFRVDKVDQEKIFPNSLRGLESGLALYRNHDMAFSRILNKPSATRQIDVEMDFFQEDAMMRLVVRDQDDIQVEIAKPAPWEQSMNQDHAHQQIETHLRRSGNTPYKVVRLTIHTSEPGFLPAATLNAIRRDALEKLTVKRVEKYARHTVPLVPNSTPYPETEIDFHGNVLNSLARKFYERHGARVVQPAFETLDDPTEKTVMTTRYCIKHQLDLCPMVGRSARTYKEPLKISDGKHRYRLKFDCQKCRMQVIFEK
jgi:23S rRNA 5-hydroxycytidine C2501 synthase